MKRLGWLPGLAGALLLLVLGTSLAAAAPARDRREMRAREAYAAGRYDDALELYVKLYAEKLHPIFLRNIGRCYQNLLQPDKAISSFREYLRKARKLEAGEREEIEGFIREMEQLRQDQTTVAAAAARPPDETTAPAAPPPSAPETPAVAATATAPPPVLDLETTAPPPEPAAPPPIYKRWWFWTAIGAALLAGTTALILSRGGEVPPCEAGRQCR
jgi:tetratricopeptide (TPR) repeat protein